MWHLLALSRGPHSHLQSSFFIVNVDVSVVSLCQADVVPGCDAVSGKKGKISIQISAHFINILYRVLQNFC